MNNKLYSRIFLLPLSLLFAGGHALSCSAAPAPAAAPVPPPAYEWEIQSDQYPDWPAGPKVAAETAVLMDVDTGNILYEKGMDEKRYPASTTKLMTALVAAEHTSPTDSVTFSAEAVNGIEPGSTHIGIKPGETLTMDQCMHAILLASANEVSSGTAEFTAGSISGFVDMMNREATALGCKNTHFMNAHGLHDPDHYTTARDLALIACKAFRNPYLKQVMAEDHFIVPVTNITNEERWLNNHHKMLVSGPQHYDGCLGGKTGYTSDAGNTLVTFASKNDMTLVCVVLADLPAFQYADTCALLDYGFSEFHKISLTAKGSFSFPATLPLDCYFYQPQTPCYMARNLKDASLILPVHMTEENLVQKSGTVNGIKTTGYFLHGCPAAESQISMDRILSFEQFISPAAYASKELKVEEEPRIPSTSSDSLEGFFDEVSYTFDSLPKWKYPALLLLVSALVFYLILIIIRIRRYRKKKKRRKRS